MAAGWTTELRSGSADRKICCVSNLMVARDGIEPPTPAFSGPRSTTELPGLGMERLVRDKPSTARGAAEGFRARSAGFQRLGEVYQSIGRVAKVEHHGYARGWGRLVRLVRWS